MNKQYDVLCAWCHTVINQSRIPNSHGICFNCVNKFLKLPDFSYEELNKLPFGAFILSQDGVVIFYNLAEATLAQKTPNQVIGRNFFNEVAPCSRVKNFQGYFQEFISSNDVSKNFNFVFFFPHGKVYVDVVFIKGNQFNVMVFVKKEEIAINKW